MLAKKYRLQIDEWLKAKKSGLLSSKSGLFIVKTSVNNLNISRFGVVISKKVSKSAVKRNKIKRLIFNFIRLNKLHEAPGRDFLITVLPKIEELEKEEIKKELADILKAQD